MNENLYKLLLHDLLNNLGSRVVIWKKNNVAFKKVKGDFSTASDEFVKN